MKQLTLTEARKARKLKQTDVAQRSGIHKAIISRLEAGITTHPRYDTVRKLEAALRLRPGTLIFGNSTEIEIEAAS